MRATMAIALKDLRLLWRDKMALFWALGFPLIMALFFGAVSGGGGERGRIEIALEDEDRTEASTRLVERLSGHPALEVVRLDAATARDQVRRGKLSAYVKVRRGGTLELGIDPGRAAERGVLQGVLAGATFEGALPAGPRIEEVSVLRDGRRPASAFEVTFPSGILWGIIGCVATFAISLATERSKGTLARLRNAPISRGQILAGKGVACFFACLAVVVLLLAFGRLFLGVRLANPLALGIAAVCTAICFVGVMMCFSVLGESERAVAGSSWGILLPLAMLGGAMIPLIAMPRWMQTVSHVSPVKWAILSLEGGIWRGFTVAELLVPCGILVGAGAAFFAAGVLIESRKET